MDTGLTFGYAAQRLQKDYLCIAPDLRGYGGSSHTENPLGYFLFEHIADLFALTRHYAGEASVRMVGHSLGANLALIFAGTFPELVSHIVSIEGYGFRGGEADAGPERLRRWVGARQRRPADAKRYKDEVAYFRRQERRFPRVDPTLDRQRHQDVLRRCASGEVHLVADPKHQWPAPPVMSLAELALFWGRISAKCLLLLGEDSEVARWIEGDSESSRLDARIKLFPQHARTVTLRECGHLLHLEKPEEVTALLEEFLR
jgi:pimeloyl-ACP methyl ester carboxylesterase